MLWLLLSRLLLSRLVLLRLRIVMPVQALPLRVRLLRLRLLRLLLPAGVVRSMLLSRVSSSSEAVSVIQSPAGPSLQHAMAVAPQRALPLAGLGRGLGICVRADAAARGGTARCGGVARSLAMRRRVPSSLAVHLI